jgi:poly(hydroxyalkanoate) granule-associated protein
MKESAQQIWLAGLGAFSKAQQEGGKAFETLVKNGIDLQRKTQETAQAKMQEATQKMTGIASELGQKSTGQWDRLETIFEDRVAKALFRMGVPSAEQLQELLARIEALESQLSSAKTSGKNARSSRATSPVAAPKTRARKAPAAKKSKSTL